MTLLLIALRVISNSWPRMLIAIPVAMSAMHE